MDRMHKQARKYWNELNLKHDREFKGKRYYTPRERTLIKIMIIALVLRLFLGLATERNKEDGSSDIGRFERDFSIYNGR